MSKKRSGQNESLLGIFCPFWSDEGPHFVLPHFQGMMIDLGVGASVLDLNIAAADAMKTDWPHLSGNGDGIWSNPEEIEEHIRRAGISEILRKALVDRRPFWVLFLGVNVAGYHAARCLMRDLRAAVQGTKTRIAVGGPVCFHLEDPSAAFPDADLVWKGPLESAFPHLLGLEPPQAVPDSPIPRYRLDFTGIDLAKYSRPERLPYLLNYGCRFRCGFCHEGAQYREAVSRSVRGLADELMTIVSTLRCVRYIRFNDGSLNGDMRQFSELLDELSRGDLLWGCNLAPSPGIDDRIAERMAAAGCLGVNIGVESGSTTVRSLMKKPFPRIDAVESCIRCLHAAGLDVSANLIAGYPGETEKQVEETIAFLDRSTPYLSDVRVGKAAIYAGTPLFGQAAALRIRLNEDLRKGFVFNHWSLSDGSNTPAVREDRLRRLESHLSDLGFKNAASSGGEDAGLRALKRIGACAE